MERSLANRMMVGSVATFVLLMAATVHAIPNTVLDFNVSFGGVAPGTTISYAGGAAPLVGQNIAVSTLSGLPGGAFGVTCTGCVLSFTTGNYSGGSATTWDFGGGLGTTITLVGEVLAAGISTPTTLLTGHFGNVVVTSYGGGFNISGGSFVDTKDPTLLAYFGLPTNIDYNGNFNISFDASGTPPNGFTSTIVYSGDVKNSPTPEPGTMMLLGSGLSGLAYLVIRRRKSA